MSEIVRGLVAKRDDEKRIAYGWASVAVDAGADVVDSEGDVVDMPSLEDAVVQFMIAKRSSKTMHTGDDVGVVVESLVVDRAKWEAMGVESNREGWWVGIHVPMSSDWEEVRSGRFSMFSIGGKGTRSEMTE